MFPSIYCTFQMGILVFLDLLMHFLTLLKQHLIQINLLQNNFKLKILILIFILIILIQRDGKHLILNTKITLSMQIIIISFIIL